MNTEIKIINKHFKHFIAFSTVGLITTILSFAATILLIEIFKVNIVIAYPAIYIISILASYYLNKEHVFKYNGEKNKLFLYFIIYLSGMLLGMLLIAVIKEITKFSDTIIAILVLPFTTIYNFILVSLIFNNDKDKSR